ncbi:hypothetical protein N9L19_01495 [bacterium]|nr:hypothetical protein [bacterium]
MPPQEDNKRGRLAESAEMLTAQQMAEVGLPFFSNDSTVLQIYPK